MAGRQEPAIVAFSQSQRQNLNQSEDGRRNVSDQNFPLTLAEVLYEELQKQHSTSAAKFDLEIAGLRAQKIWPRRNTICRKIVPRIYDEIRMLAKADPKTARSALCLSGGGIRSAIFKDRKSV